MRFERLKVVNFRGVSHFEIDNLQDLVVVAGPNGSGKSAALDAIRLLKSAYGGYQANEVQSWFGEFQINLARVEELVRVLRRRDQPLEIEAVVELSLSERQYLDKNAEALLSPLIWQEVAGRDAPNRWRTQALSVDLRRHQPEVSAAVAERSAEIRTSLGDNRPFLLRLVLGSNGVADVEQQPVMDLMFQTYDPQHLGVIDYHSASRSYQREQIGGINLSLDSFEERRRSSALYNSQNKYQNVKTELATTYVRDLIAGTAGSPPTQTDLNETLTELFQTFFPDKRYLGPRAKPDGSLEFPVVLSTGEEHDIDELSSGEKEVLYGYLRLRNSAPRDSVILLDEPELHLNPGLLQGFPDFYHRHLGRAVANQIWMTTHSDTLLRQAVGNSNFSVFHMRAPSPTFVGNQALPVIADSELDRAVIDLVGDLAAYKPRADVVIVEGGGNTDFDVQMLSRLFPEFSRSVNLVSGGSKRRVRDLYSLLDSASQQIGLERRFFAIVDRDHDVAMTTIPSEANVKAWDRYHIENYLLEPAFILDALRAVNPNAALTSEDDVRAALLACAAEIVPEVVLEQVQTRANDSLVQAILVKGPPSGPASGLAPSIESSKERFNHAVNELLAVDALENLQNEIRAGFASSLLDDTWVALVPARPTLARFVGKHVQGLNYEAFRYLILDQMADADFRPVGMRAVIDEIVPDSAHVE